MESIKTNVFLMWTICLLTYSLFSYPLLVKFWFLSDLLGIVLLFVGVLYFVVSYAKYSKKGNIKSVFYYFLKLVSVVVVAVLLFFNSYEIFTILKMPQYQEIVGLIQSEKLTSSDSPYKDIYFETDVSDGQLRVAFPDGTGILDNWCALIWDETGFVMEASVFKPDWSNWDEEGLQRVKKLFNGDLMNAKHFYGPWYIGCFT
ncbi:hypothetical protein KC906_02190 [Candidatus Kaiserbacteria bacterium]|nr:hypothetical protein [Candidatus Kaiserbacteria bacterium]MCB9812148.1 hypothetical protein [Candidatus Nomurabacteria bacterium]